MKHIFTKLKNKTNVITTIQLILAIILLAMSIKGNMLWTCLAVAIVKVDVENILKT